MFRASAHQASLADFKPAHSADDTLNHLSVEQVICEDLRAFESRLTEIINTVEPRTKCWRVVLALNLALTLACAINWLMDSETFEVSFMDSLLKHCWFAISAALLIVLFATGIHHRVMATSIYRARMREVVAEFNMDLDEVGRLILMPNFNLRHNGYQRHPHHF